MVSRRMLVTPLLAALLTLFTVACDGGARPTPTPEIRPTPTEARATPTPEKNSPNQNIVTPTPFTREPTPTATIEPTPTPDIVSFPIIVECPPPACTPEELAYYNKRFREEFDYLTTLFGIDPREQLVFKSSDGEGFAYVGNRWKAGVSKYQISDTEFNGLRHELMHGLIQTGIRWYDESIADLAARFDWYTEGGLRLDTEGLRLYDNVKLERRIVSSYAHGKGRIFNSVLRRDFSIDGNDFRNKITKATATIYEIVRQNGYATEEQIFSAYGNFGELSGFQSNMSYLQIQ